MSEAQQFNQDREPSRAPLWVGDEVFRSGETPQPVPIEIRNSIVITGLNFARSNAEYTPEAEQQVTRLYPAQQFPELPPAA
ncbi:hypothetical protein KW801_01115 [Candidatus Saccharibacteria bacterium]|nr:hypothetical protein [Candidatus Saccharibacteria bacterium]